MDHNADYEYKKQRKGFIIASVIVIHVIVDLAVYFRSQSFMLGPVAAYHYTESEVIISFIIGCFLILADYFIIRLIIKRNRSIFTANKVIIYLINLVDLVIIIPQIVTLVIFIFSVKSTYSNDEILVLSLIISIDVLLILERIIIILRSKDKKNIALI